jgi:hypothetical protein
MWSLHSSYHLSLFLHERECEAQKRETKLANKLEEIRKALARNQKEHDFLQRDLEETKHLQQKEMQELEDIRKRQAEMLAAQQEKEAAKLTEGESAARSVSAATDAIPKGWFSIQPACMGANKLPSYGDPGTLFDVRFDEGTKIFLMKEVEGVKTYAVRCRTVLGNDVVVLFKGNIIWRG